MINVITDMFGNTLRRGDFISYPGRAGSSLFVNLAVYLTRKPNGKIQVAIPSIKTKITDDGEVIQRKVTRKASVGVLDRIIKVPDSFLSNINMESHVKSKIERLLLIQHDALEGAL